MKQVRIATCHSDRIPAATWDCGKSHMKAEQGFKAQNAFSSCNPQSNQDMWKNFFFKHDSQQKQ